MTEFSEEQVEAAAQALHEASPGQPKWDWDTAKYGQEAYRRMARAALTAAAQAQPVVETGDEPELCGLEACDVGGFCQARSDCRAAQPVVETDIKILDAKALFDLPDGTVLRHPRLDALVERYNRTPPQWSAMGSANVADAVRIGGHLQNAESLLPNYDFPMEVLYHPHMRRSRKERAA